MINYLIIPKSKGQKKKCGAGWTHRPFRSPAAVATKAPHAMSLPPQHASARGASVPLPAGPAVPVPTRQRPSASNPQPINSHGGERWCSSTSPASASSPLTHPPVCHPPLCPPSPRESEATHTYPPVLEASFCGGEEGRIAAPCRSTSSPTRYP